MKVRISARVTEFIKLPRENGVAEIPDRTEDFLRMIATSDEGRFSVCLKKSEEDGFHEITPDPELITLYFENDYD